MQAVPLLNGTSLWKRNGRKQRLLLYFAVVLGIAAWKFVPRPWHPSLKLEKSHHLLFSTATPEQTEQTAHALELLYTAYSNRFGSVTGFERNHHPLQVKLFRDRAEFRRINPGLGWAEAFYREPYCRAYFSAEENNPYHWMLHESVHQLNNEVAHLKLEKWLEEGLADYFATSRLGTNGLDVGRIDPDTYPVWWLDTLATSTNLAENIDNGSVIPLRTIITNRGGPSMRRHFNLYYLHWWTLTHFLFESPEYRERALSLVQKGGSITDFEQIIGPVERLQDKWHSYVQRLKTAVAGKRAAVRLKRVGVAEAKNTPMI